MRPTSRAPCATFGQASAYYDANGRYARVSPILPDFKLGAKNTLTPTTPAGACRRSKPVSCAAARARATQPAADGSSPFADAELFSCDPLADALMDRRRTQLARRQPAADRRDHDADRGRRRVPLLQRQQRPAVRADVQHQSRAARGLGPAAVQPGADRRHARRHRQLAQPPPEPARPAASPRSPNLKLEKKVEPLPADTKAIVQSVSAIGLKYLELEKGNSKQTLKAGRTIPVSQTTRTGRHRRTLQHVRPEDAERRSRSTRTTSATVSPGAGSGSTTRSHDCARSSRTRYRCCTTSPRRRRTCAGCSSALDRAASQTAPVAQAQAELLHRPRHLLHGLRERRAVARSSHRGRSGVAANRRPTRSRTRRRSSKTRPSSCTCCAPARRR